MTLIGDLAVVCKSKEIFENVKASGVLCEDLFARLYNVRADEIIFTVYDAGLAFKATLPRLIPAGDIGDTDVYGAQQHAPLLAVEVPV